MHIPPVSDLIGQDTLLDTKLMREYFTEFNKRVDEFSQKENMIDVRTQYLYMSQLLKEDC